MPEEVNYDPAAILEALNFKVDLDFGNAQMDSFIGAIAVANGLPKVNHKRGEWLFGFYIDETRSNPYEAVQYMPGCDNMLFAPAKMNFTQDKFEYGGWLNAPYIPKPCMLRSDGVVDYYLNPDDYTKRATGGDSDVTNTSYDGNAMVEWPCIYNYKYKDGNRIVWLFSNKKCNDNFVCYPCLKADGTYADKFYTPCYEGTYINSKMRSLSTGGKPGASQTSATEVTHARANGSNWDTTTQADEDLIWGLTVLMFKTLDIQSALGYGATASSSALTVNTGVCNTKGLFYGTSAASSSGIKLFGMEQWYAHRWRRHQGMLLIDGTYWVKMTKSMQDGSTVSDYNDTGTGYINTGIKAPSASESYIKQMAVTPYGLLPVAVGASATTYYCDGMWSNLSGVRKPLRGGVVNNGLIDGVSAVDVFNVPSNSGWDRGASLSYHL